MGEAEVACECAWLWVCWLVVRVGCWGRGDTLQVWTGQAQRNHAWPRSHRTSLYWAVKDDAGFCVWHLASKLKGRHALSRLFPDAFWISPSLSAAPFRHTKYVDHALPKHCQGRSLLVILSHRNNLGWRGRPARNSPSPSINQEPWICWFERKNHTAWAFRWSAEARAKLHLSLSCLG